ncbi:hypothetical protein LCGC14_2653320 [marine sediment metagenome]|uniref:Uncharacterized protein n=1 Tax=marine sediment metagenome TaxID=412755 RepID=A0A0F9C4K4_9ZZZZ
MNGHTTTMSPWQRNELVRILRMSWSFEELAVLTDTQLCDQWMAQCEYVPAEKAPLRPLWEGDES